MRKKQSLLIFVVWVLMRWEDERDVEQPQASRERNGCAAQMLNKWEGEREISLPIFVVWQSSDAQVKGGRMREKRRPRRPFRDVAASATLPATHDERSSNFFSQKKTLS